MENKKKTRKKTFLFIIVFMIIGFLIGSFIFKTVNKIEPVEISYTEFLQKIDSGAIDTITMEQDSTTVEASSKNKDTEETIYYTVMIPNEESFVNFIQERITNENSIPELKIKEISSVNGFEIFSILFSIFQIVLIFILFRNLWKLIKAFSNKSKNDSKKNNSDSTPSFMNIFNTDINYIEKIVNSNVKFSDVAGLDEEKEELIEIVDFLKNPEKYAQIGAKIPRGILLSGAPGTGKTLLAKAVAGEAGVSYLAISGSEFIEKYVGVGASRIRNLFKEARKNAPCIIFIDEIDAVGAKREDGGNSEHNQTIEQLLTELDGFEDRSNIIVLAATNRLSSLDPALTRPGRFDRKINVRLPDVNGREEILKLHAKNKSFERNIDFRHLALNTSGYSGAELANLINESALIAAKKEHIAVTKEDLDDALRKITIGLSKSKYAISEKERHITAVHEAGHAITGHLLKTQSKIKEISIVPRGTAGGYTWQTRVEDKSYLSKKELEKELIVLLAGRVAERLFIGDISSGAAHDLKVATSIAKDMVSIYGMDDEIGPISLSGFRASEIGPVAGNIARKVTDILKNSEKEAEKMLTDNLNSEILKNIVSKLLEKETLSGEEFENIFSESMKVSN